jgi:hypothetical protein
MTRSCTFKTAPANYTVLLYTEFENLKAVTMTSLWGVTPCSPVEVHTCHEGTFCLHPQSRRICRGADKSSAFPIFLFAAQPKEFFLDGLKNLKQRSHKCVELREEYVQ